MKVMYKSDGSEIYFRTKDKRKLSKPFNIEIYHAMGGHVPGYLRYREGSLVIVRPSVFRNKGAKGVLVCLAIKTSQVGRFVSSVPVPEPHDGN